MGPINKSIWSFVRPLKETTQGEELTPQISLKPDKEAQQYDGY